MIFFYGVYFFSPLKAFICTWNSFVLDMAMTCLFHFIAQMQPNQRIVC